MKTRSNSQDKPVLRRTFKYRCYLNRSTQRRARELMAHGCKPIYNAALAQRNENFQAIRAAKKAGQEPPKKVTVFSQYELIRLTDHPELGRYPIRVLQETLRTLNANFKSFYGLVEKGHTDARPPGHMKFCGWFTYSQHGWRLDGSNLYLSKIGRVKLRLHRPIEGRIKTVTIREKNGKWYACFSCEITDFQGVRDPVFAPRSCVPQGLQQKYTLAGGSGPGKDGTHDLLPRPAIRYAGGSDPEQGGAHDIQSIAAKSMSSGCGLEQAGKHDSDCSLPCVSGDGREKMSRVTLYFPGDVFLCDSTGLEVPHPEFHFSEIDELRRLSRSLSRKQYARPGHNGKRDGDFRGRNRGRAKRALANWHEHIAAKRDHFLWAWARYYASRFLMIEVPEWPLKQEIQYAVESRTAMRLCDAAYGRFISMLKQKAQEFGAEVVPHRDEDLWREELAIFRRVAHSEAERALLYKMRKAVNRGRRELFGRLMDEYRKLQQMEQEHGSG